VLRFVLRFALPIILLAPAAARASVIRVPDDVTDIDRALFWAAPYDTVLVAPGVYDENIEWPSKAGIKLLSEAGPESTAIDGGGLASVIGIYSGVDTTTVISGFTIRNGFAEGY
jgi:hypothetical protein